MERKTLREYLHHAFMNLAGNVADLMEKFPDEENGCDNEAVVDAMHEMHQSLLTLAGKAARDLRLLDTRTCQECFNDFNYQAAPYRFCSDMCERKYDLGVMGESNEDFDE